MWKSLSDVFRLFGGEHIKLQIVIQLSNNPERNVQRGNEEDVAFRIKLRVQGTYDKVDALGYPIRSRLIGQSVFSPKDILNDRDIPCVQI